MHGEGGMSAAHENHPPVKGEGRTAGGSPGWGGCGSAHDVDAEFAAQPALPPDPLARADLPLPGGCVHPWNRVS